jgi:hypothetical protein
MVFINTRNKPEQQEDEQQQTTMEIKVRQVFFLLTKKKKQREDLNRESRYYNKRIETRTKQTVARTITDILFFRQEP